MVLARALKQCCQRIQREQELACVVILDGLSGIYKLVHLYRRLRIGRGCEGVRMYLGVRVQP